MDEFDQGFLLGLLVGAGSFGGDGRQPAITVRMHVRHEALFRHLARIVPGSRLYGPYRHSGREYFQWLLRGPALRRTLPLLDRHLTSEIDGHAAQRYGHMKQTYARALGLAPSPQDSARSDQQHPGRTDTAPGIKGPASDPHDDIADR